MLVAITASCRLSRKPADEAVVVGNGQEPAQRIALRGKRGDLLAEEREPGNEHERRQDIASVIPAAPLSATRPSNGANSAHDLTG